MKVNFILKEDYNVEKLNEQTLKTIFISKYYSYIKKRENIVS